MGSNISHDLPSARSINLFRSKIVRWFNTNERNYPWRIANDPFKVLIAEMMLRRTKTDQVEGVYNKLFERYPDVQTLARASDEDLKQILYPLGLKWRVPAFRIVAQEIKEKYECNVPKTRQELIALPGVGDYVAGAVLSLAYGKKEWIVDSNVVRLFKRFFGVASSKEGRRDKHIIEMAKIYVSAKDPRKANLAILDFTALVCTPRKPNCEECPLNRGCKYPDKRHHQGS